MAAIACQIRTTAAKFIFGDTPTSLRLPLSPPLLP